jgi:hypothetical protein
MNETQALLQLVSKHFGHAVGKKIKDEISVIVGANDIDLAQLQASIATIQGMLDADEGTVEFDVGANIVTQLTDHLARITGLEAGLVTLNANESTVGSVAYAVKAERDRAVVAEATLQSGIDANTADVATLNGDDTVAGSVAKTVKDAVDAEALTRANADTALQDQIDVITGGGTGSVAGLQTEVNATQVGAGLEEDGSYLANNGANYIDTATSLKDADNKLDSAIKAVDDARIADKSAGDTAVANAQAKADANETAIATLNGDDTVDGSVAKVAKDSAVLASAGAVATAKTYADATFVTKADIAVIDEVALYTLFTNAINCGFSGASITDVLNGTGDCADAGGGDGAVI